MDLTFQIPVQYRLQQWILLLSPVTSITGFCFHFDSASSFLLESFLCSSPVAYWATVDLGFHLQCHIILPFHAVHRVLKARILKWFAISVGIFIMGEAMHMWEQGKYEKCLYLLFNVAMSLKLP